MPLTWEGMRGIHFNEPTKKKITKKTARQQRARKACALRFGWSSEDYDRAINGEIAYANYGMIDLENYLHGIDEPVLLEQDVIPFNLPHINQIAAAAWKRDIDAIDQSLSEIPREVREKAFCFLSTTTTSTGSTTIRRATHHRTTLVSFWTMKRMCNKHSPKKQPNL